MVNSTATPLRSSGLRLVHVALDVWQLASDLVDEVVAQLVRQVGGANVVKVPEGCGVRHTAEASLGATT